MMRYSAPSNRAVEQRLDATNFDLFQVAYLRKTRTSFSPTRTGPGFGFFSPNRPFRQWTQPTTLLSLSLLESLSYKSRGIFIAIISRRHDEPSPKLVQHHEH